MKKILLAGGGHGHINILKQLIKRPLHGYEITLVTDFQRQYYSGMLPGFLEGIYSEDEISFDIPSLCERAGVKFIHDKILEIDGTKQCVITQHRQLDYDFLSMNLGSRSREDFLIGYQEIYVKPISTIVKFRNLLDENLILKNSKLLKRNTTDIGGSGDTAQQGVQKESAASNENAATYAGVSQKNTEGNTTCDFRKAAPPTSARKKLLLVGGGASGVELAMALSSRYENLDIKIITKNPQLIPLFNRQSRHLIEKLLLQKGIYFRVNERVVDIKNHQIITDRNEYPYDFVMISTGFVGCDIRFRGFDTTEDNFVLVDKNLCADVRSVAMGDMVTLRHAPDTHKAGVFAIRQAPVLYQNLMRLIQGESSLQEYSPQKHYLQVINTGNKTAVLNKSRFSFYGRLAWRIKDYIDRKYMKE